MSILSRSSELKHPLRNSKKPSSDLMSNKGLSYVREKIRTPDLLVRSQTLYPAELRAHIIFACLSYLCTSATKLIIAQRFLSVNNFFHFFYFYFSAKINPISQLRFFGKLSTGVGAQSAPPLCLFHSLIFTRRIQPCNLPGILQFPDLSMDVWSSAQ